MYYISNNLVWGELMAETEEIAEYNKPIASDKDFTVIKQKYLSQVVRKRAKQSYNIKTLNDCRLIHDETCDAGKPGARMAYTNMSNIYYGKGYSPMVTRFMLFHEIDHIRKGNQYVNRSARSSVGKSLTEDGRVTIKRTDKAIFFEEGFAHANAYSFFKGAYTTGDSKKDAVEFKEVDDFYKNSPYKYNVDVTAKIMSLLNLKIDKFEKMVTERNIKGSDEIDKLFFKLTGDKNFFKKLEKNLNYYGTYVYQQAAGQKLDTESKKKLDACKTEIDALLVYAQKIKDGFEKKVGFFGRLFGAKKKQDQNIMYCLGQSPDYQGAFNEMLLNDSEISSVETGYISSSSSSTDYSSTEEFDSGEEKGMDFCQISLPDGSTQTVNTNADEMDAPESSVAEEEKSHS